MCGGFERLTAEEANFFREAKALLGKSEGAVNHMYRDSSEKGVVTIGKGHALFSVEDLAEINWTGAPGARTPVEEYTAIMKLPAGRLASFYEPHCQLWISCREIDRIFENDIFETLRQLRREFRNFDSFPTSAKLAVLDMGFNLGVFGLTRSFPNCTAAIRRQDWRRAAEECHRLDVSESRNEEVMGLFLKAAK